MSELHDYLRTRLRGPGADTTPTYERANRGVLRAILLAESGSSVAFISSTYRSSLDAIVAAVKVCDGVRIPVDITSHARDTRLDFASGGVIRFLPTNAEIEKLAGLEFTSVFVEEMGS